MNNRTMVKLNACGEILDIQTFPAEKQSPHRFAVLRSDLARLETQHQTNFGIGPVLFRQDVAGADVRSRNLSPY